MVASAWADQLARIYRRGARLRARELTRRAAWRIARDHAARHPGTDVREMVRELLVRAAERTAAGCVAAAAVLALPPAWAEGVHWWLMVGWGAL